MAKNLSAKLYVNVAIVATHITHNLYAVIPAVALHQDAVLFPTIHIGPKSIHQYPLDFSSHNEMY